MRTAFLIAALIALAVMGAAAGPAPSTDGYLVLPRQAGFSLRYAKGYKVLTVASPWPGAGREYRYVLHPRGTARPAGETADRFIQTPVRSVVTFSTSYLPAIERIGAADSIVGTDDPAFVYSPAIRKRIAEGKVVGTTKNWAPDIERLISLAPDLVLAYGMGNEWDMHPKMEQARLPVVIVGEWNETDPLSRALWSVFIAAFWDREADALATYGETAASYERVRERAARAARKPAVLVNGPFQGVWSVSGGRSFMARLIADAGGRYLWADDPATGGVNLSVEAVFARAAGADLWLNPSLSVRTLADLRAMDPRFSGLKPVRSGGVWNNTLRMSPGGGSDYFESAAMRPDLVLADLAAVFHPELFPGHVFSYYRRIGE